MNVTVKSTKHFFIPYKTSVMQDWKSSLLNSLLCKERNKQQRSWRGKERLLQEGRRAAEGGCRGMNSSCPKAGCTGERSPYPLTEPPKPLTSNLPETLTNPAHGISPDMAPALIFHPLKSTTPSAARASQGHLKGKKGNWRLPCSAGSS